MPDELEQLVESLLWEGYALYPYTPVATKNATPTPFGIVYPPAYAATLESTFDHLELRCVLLAEQEACVRAEVRFLAATGERHRATAQRLSLPPAPLELLLISSDRAPPALTIEQDFDASAGVRLRVRAGLSALALESGSFELRFRIENRTACSEGLDRRAALTRALISTHPFVRVTGGRLISPLERPLASVNTFPVLAGGGEDAVLGAAIVLPDHPQIAPESHGAMFDSTEIEEALLLHVRTLTDEERAQIEQDDDPHVREMLARATAATPADVLALHGRVTVRDPGEIAAVGEARGERARFTATPPVEPAGLPDPRVGEPEADVEGVRLRRGGKVRLRPGEEADLHARLLDGRVATVERILVDYDGRTHLGVTIDGDPGQELMRDSGRLLFFFPAEVEVLQT